MFGYVNVFRDELKIKDYNTYRAYYCGLCKTLGKKHNQLVRLSLNYDLTFLALIIDALSDKPHDFCMSGCIKKLGKRKIINAACGLEFAADMNVLLAYFKLKDDIADNSSLKARIAILPFLRRAKRIKRDYPELYDAVSVSLQRLSFLEEMNCAIMDKAAHEFAVIMCSIFENADKSLGKFGYLLGRLIYIMDACDDMPDDFKNKNYNPAVIQYSYKGTLTEDIKKSMTDNLYYSLAELADCYEKLEIKKNKAVLDNIIYLGIRAKCDSIINERKKNNEKSL